MSLREILIDELRDLYSAENQLVKSLPKVAKACESEELKQIFVHHLDETKEHVQRLRQAFEILGKKPTGKHCSGMEGAIDEVKEALEEDEEGALYDCGIVGAAARVEHYEIAGYTVATLIATTLGEGEIVSLLKQTLAEEQMAAKTVLAASKVILKQALAEEGDDKQVPEKKAKAPKEKQSEKESEQDEAEAAPELNKGSDESVDAAPSKKSAKKKK
jgi:ferritin-like metal-binding protein YciE